MRAKDRAKGSLVKREELGDWGLEADAGGGGGVFRNEPLKLPLFIFLRGGCNIRPNYKPFSNKTINTDEDTKKVGFHKNRPKS